MERPQVIVIAGPNGAGKTTLAPFLLRDEFGITEYVNADTIAAGLSAFDPAGAAFEAGRVMLARLRELARERRSFAFETTLATRSYAPFVRRLKREGYEFALLFLWLRSPELASERVKWRAVSGGHHVAPHVVRRRYFGGARNFFRLYRPLADSWLVCDNSTSGRPSRVAVGRGATVGQIWDTSLWRQFSETAK